MHRLQEFMEHFRLHHHDRGDAEVAAILQVGEEIREEIRQSTNRIIAAIRPVGPPVKVLVTLGQSIPQ